VVRLSQQSCTHRRERVPEWVTEWPICGGDRGDRGELLGHIQPGSTVCAHGDRVRRVQNERWDDSVRLTPWVRGYSVSAVV